MKSKVLIAGSGNTTGINVIKSLIKDTNVIGCDFNNINPADKLCKNFVIPPCSSSFYNEAILNLVKKEEVTHIFASNDHDVRALSLINPQLTELGITFNGYNDNISLDCLDKDKTYHLFVYNNILTPEEIDVNDIEKNLPCVIRIKSMGRIKKFVHILKSRKDAFIIPQEHLDNCIVTKFIEGEEYTTDYLADNNSNLICAIPRLRLEVRNGMVWQGKVVHDIYLIELISEIVKKLKLVGVGCIQCIKDKVGGYYFIEINPRPGSGIDLSVNSGANLPLMWLNMQQGLSLQQPNINWNTQMIRYNSAYYFKG